jgi:hypothetical protein
MRQQSTVSTGYMNGHWRVFMLLNALLLNKDFAAMFGLEL